MTMRERDRQHFGASVGFRPNVRTPKFIEIGPRYPNVDNQTNREWWEIAMAEHQPPPRWKTFGLNLLWSIGGPAIAVALAMLLGIVVWWVGG